MNRPNCKKVIPMSLQLFKNTSVRLDQRSKAGKHKNSISLYLKVGYLLLTVLSQPREEKRSCTTLEVNTSPRQSLPGNEFPDYSIQAIYTKLIYSGCRSRFLWALQRV